MGRSAFNNRWGQGVETLNDPLSFQAPSTDRINLGWEGGQDKDAPPAGQENWWHNRVDSAMQDIERKGAMLWAADAIYRVGAPCYASDDYFYESVVNNNTGNNPLSSTGYWRQIGRSLFAGFSVGEYKDVSHNGSADSGWLKCNGAILLRSAYAALFSMIGTNYNIGGELSTQFRLPDWRGMFGRGLDDGRGINQGRALSNNPEPSQNLSHGHAATIGSAGLHSHISTFLRELVPAGSLDNAVLGDQQTQGTQDIATNSAGAHTHTASISSSGGTEARPINLPFVRWIRYQ